MTVVSSQARISEEYRSCLPVRVYQVIIQKAWGLSGDNTEVLVAIIGHVNPHCIGTT